MNNVRTVKIVAHGRRSLNSAISEEEFEIDAINPTSEHVGDFEFVADALEHAGELTEFDGGVTSMTIYLHESRVEEAI
jgi:hypothetical protein